MKFCLIPWLLIVLFSILISLIVVLLSIKLISASKLSSTNSRFECPQLEMSSRCTLFFWRRLFNIWLIPLPTIGVIDSPRYSKFPSNYWIPLAKWSQKSKFKSFPFSSRCCNDRTKLKNFSKHSPESSEVMEQKDKSRNFKFSISIIGSSRWRIFIGSLKSLRRNAKLSNIFNRIKAFPMFVMSFEATWKNRRS